MKVGMGEMTNSTSSLSRATTDSSVRPARHAFTSPIVAAVSSFFLRCCIPIRPSLIASGKRQDVSSIKLPTIVGICSTLPCSALLYASPKTPTLPLPTLLVMSQKLRPLPLLRLLFFVLWLAQLELAVGACSTGFRREGVKV